MTLCDAGDEVIVFTPYYFNHVMALQLINAKVGFQTRRARLRVCSLGLASSLCLRRAARTT